MKVFIYEFAISTALIVEHLVEWSLRGRGRRKEEGRGR
jgi:hypothetical protein